MSVIIPDTNVILAAALKFTYAGTIHTQHQFHVESFQLLDTIKENSNVKGILLPKVDEESKNKLPTAFFDLRIKTMARQVVRNVASKAAKEAAENMAKKTKENPTDLQKQYFKIIVEDHHLSHPCDIKSKDLSRDAPIEIVYLRDLYSVLSVTYINWNNFQGEKLRDRIESLLDRASGIVARYTGVRVDRWEVNWLQIIKDKIKRMRFYYSSIEKAKIRCRVQMRKLKKDLKDDVVMPKSQLEWHANNVTTDTHDPQLRVKRMFKYLKGDYNDIIKKMFELRDDYIREKIKICWYKYIREKMSKYLKVDSKDIKLPFQLFEHIKSEEYDEHPHDNDKLILAQTIYITSVYSESKIYIASNDKKFFSPYYDDRTITDAICDEFEITCDSPKKILDIVQQNSTDKCEKSKKK